MVQDHVLPEVSKDHDEDREQERKVEELGSCLTSGFRIFLPRYWPEMTAPPASREKILMMSSMTVSTKETPQTAASPTRHHDRVGKSHGLKKLIYDQRDDQAHQVFPAEKMVIHM